MANKTLTGARIQLRRDTASNWSSKNPVLLVGEAGYDTTNRILKIGNGSTPWNSLLEAHSNSGVTAGYAGHSSFSETSRVSIPYLHINAQGHITSKATNTFKVCTECTTIWSGLSDHAGYDDITQSGSINFEPNKVYQVEITRGSKDYKTDIVFIFSVPAAFGESDADATIVLHNFTKYYDGGYKGDFVELRVTHSYESIRDQIDNTWVDVPWNDVNVYSYPLNADGSINLSSSSNAIYKIKKISRL